MKCQRNMAWLGVLAVGLERIHTTSCHGMLLVTIAVRPAPLVAAGNQNTLKLIEQQLRTTGIKSNKKHQHVNDLDPP